MHEPTPTPPPRSRPKTTYYHNGIGGRGNYHKHEASDQKQSRSHFTWALAVLFSGSSGSNAQHTTEEPPSREALKGGRIRESHFPSRWFGGVGGFGNWKTRRQHSSASDMSSTTVTSGHSTPLPVGAADMMRKKILGERSATKTGED